MDLYVVGNKSSSMNDIGLCASGARMDRKLQEWVFVVAVNRDTRHLLVMTLISIFECYKLSALYSINMINRAGVLTSVINFYKHIYRIRLVKRVSKIIIRIMEAYIILSPVACSTARLQREPETLNDRTGKVQNFKCRISVFT